MFVLIYYTNKKPLLREISNENEVSKYIRDYSFEECYLFDKNIYKYACKDNHNLIDMLNMDAELNSRYIDETMSLDDRYCSKNYNKIVIRNYYNFNNGFIYFESSRMVELIKEQ